MRPGSCSLGFCAQHGALFLTPCLVAHPPWSFYRLFAANTDTASKKLLCCLWSASSCPLSIAMWWITNPSSSGWRVCPRVSVPALSSGSSPASSFQTRWPSQPTPQRLIPPSSGMCSLRLRSAPFPLGLVLTHPECSPWAPPISARQLYLSGVLRQRDMPPFWACLYHCMFRSTLSQTVRPSSAFPLFSTSPCLCLSCSPHPLLHTPLGSWGSLADGTDTSSVTFL